MSNFDYLTLPDKYITKWTVAKSSHVCYECDNNIEPKETYMLITKHWLGRWTYYRLCERCYSIEASLNEARYPTERGKIWQSYQNYLTKIGSKKFAVEIMRIKRNYDY